MISKQSQARKGKKPPSLSTLNKLWRKAVLKLWNCHCVLCGKAQPPSNLDCHHVIHRSQSGLLKWHLHNGVAVCNTASGMEEKECAECGYVGLEEYTCHQIAHRKWGKEAIRKVLGEVIYGQLVELDRKTLKQHLAETGMTRAEWLTEQGEKLKQFLEEK